MPTAPAFEPWYKARHFRPGTHVKIICAGGYKGVPATVTRYDPLTGCVRIKNPHRWGGELCGPASYFEVIDAAP